MPTKLESALGLVRSAQSLFEALADEAYRNSGVASSELLKYEYALDALAASIADFK